MADTAGGNPGMNKLARVLQQRIKETMEDPGEVLQEGTEQSATNFNHMEQGILEAHEMSAEAVRMLKSVMRKVL